MFIIVKIAIFSECDAVQFGVTELALLHLAQEGNGILQQSVYCLPQTASLSSSQEIIQS
jgi:hypothetical protein